MTEGKLMKAIVPNPGTPEAIGAGCTCPVIDNHYGRGYGGRPGVFVYFSGCPVHYPKDALREANGHD